MVGACHGATDVNPRYETPFNVRLEIGTGMCKFEYNLFEFNADTSVVNIPGNTPEP